MKPLQQVKRKEVGRYLDPKLLDHMTDEQIVQLYELHKAASAEETEEKKEWVKNSAQKLDVYQLVASWVRISDELVVLWDASKIDWSDIKEFEMVLNLESFFFNNEIDHNPKLNL